MPIRPLDVVKSQEASQIKHVENQRLVSAQAQTSKNVEDSIRDKRTKTKETDKGDNTEYRYDAKEKGNTSYHSSQKRKKNEKDKENKKSSTKPGKTGGIDILI